MKYSELKDALEKEKKRGKSMAMRLGRMHEKNQKLKEQIDKLSE